MTTRVESSPRESARSEGRRWVARILGGDAERTGECDGRKGRLPSSADVFALLPGASGPSLLVPLATRPAASAALWLLNPMTRKHRLVRDLLALGFRTGLAQPLCRMRLEIPVDGGPGARGEGDRPLKPLLQGAFGRPDIHIAVLLGEHGPHRKPVLQICASDGEILGYAKIGWDATTRGLVRHEGHVLQMLRAEGLDRRRLPAVLGTARRGHDLVVVQSGPPGIAVGGPVRWTRAHLDFVVALHHARPSRMRLTASPFWNDLPARLDRLATDPRCRRELELLGRTVERLAIDCGGTQLPFGWAHRDFAPWNTKSTSQGLFVFDWEYAAANAPAAWDLYHFFAQRGVLLDRWDAAAGFRTLTAGDGRRWVRRYLQSIGAPPNDADPLLLLYLVDTLLWWLLDRPREGARADRQRDFRAGLLALLMSDHER